MSSEARIYLVHYRVSFPQPGRLFFSVTGVRKRDGYTSNFLDKIRAQIVFYLTFARSEKYLTGLLYFFLRFWMDRTCAGSPQYRSPEIRTGKPQIFGQIQCNPVFDATTPPPMRTGTIFTSSREAGSAPDCFNELAACLRKVTSDFPSTRTIPCALSIPVSGSTPGLSVASFSTASSGILLRVHPPHFG